MTRRMDIELTSRRDDGSWTWRAPGARQPRGSLDGTLLPPGAAVGQVLRADAEFELDGIVVTAVLAPKDTHGDSVGARRLEILGSGREVKVGVSVTMAPGSRRRREDDSTAPPNGRGRPDRARRRSGGAEPSEGDSTISARGERASPGPERARPRRERPSGPGDAASTRKPPGRPERAERPDRAQRPDRATATRGARPRDETADRRDRRKLEQLTTNRNAALAGLRPEQLPVAEQLLRGGLPAVRRAIEEQNARARSEDRAEVSPEPLLAMAEELLPAMSLAAWKDRALAVRNAGRDAPLRETRSVVSGSSVVTLDDEARALVAALRESLETRITALRDSWLGRITTALDGNRLADALRVSSRPPEPSARLPAGLAVRLAASASAAMSAELSEDRWSDLLGAVVESPVRRTVKPAGIPAEAGEDLLLAARRAAGLVPELARLLGLPIPPPPGPRRTAAVGRRA